MSDQPYVTIVADPPWQYGDQLTMSATKRGSAANYPTMTVDQICDLYSPSVLRGTGPMAGMTAVKRYGHLVSYPIADVAFLNLWVTKDILLEGIHNRVCDAWGFTPKQIVPWIKGRIDIAYATYYVDTNSGERWADPYGKLTLQMGMGRIFRNVVEYLVVAARGKYTSLVTHNGTNNLILAEEDSIILAPRSNHSTKPEASYQLIEKVMPGPYLELFARRPRAGWTTWGNEVPLIPDSNYVYPEPPIEWP